MREESTSSIPVKGKPEETEVAARPQDPWLRLLAVVSTLAVASGVGVLMVSVVRWLGIDPQDLHGTGFVVRFGTVAAGTLLLALEVLPIAVSLRRVHRRPFRDLGFRAPGVKHLAIGFVAGVAVWSAPLAADLLAGAKRVAWAVPAEVSALELIGYYGVFLFVLTANSFCEEFVYRCYPIEQFRDGQAMMVLAIVSSALIFSGAHFVLDPFSLGKFVVFAAYACLYSYVYLYYRSIWLLIGLHNGINFIPFTVAGNWKMGGLVNLSGESTSGAAVLIALLAPILAIVLLYRLRPRSG